MLTQAQLMERHNYYSDSRVISQMAGETSDFLKDGVFQWSFFENEYLDEDIQQDILVGDWKKTSDYIRDHLSISKDVDWSDLSEEDQGKLSSFVEDNYTKTFLIWLKSEWSEFSKIDLKEVLESEQKHLSMPHYTSPAKWAICSICEGEGKTVNPSIDCGGITQSQWEDEWDYEEREAYMSGRYDVTCSNCNGSGKVMAYNYQENSFLAWCADKHADACQQRWYDAEERAAELRFGC